MEVVGENGLLLPICNPSQYNFTKPSAMGGGKSKGVGSKGTGNKSNRERGTGKGGCMGRRGKDGSSWQTAPLLNLSVRGECEGDGPGHGREAARDPPLAPLTPPLPRASLVLVVTHTY